MSLKSLYLLLQAMRWMYQHMHWLVTGDVSYSHHLLFERFYDTLAKEVDELAEKMVAYYGLGALNPFMDLTEIQSHVSSLSLDTSFIQVGLEMERRLSESLSQTYAELKEQGALPLGLDDWIMSTANTHETHLYLLIQAQRGKVASGAPSAEHMFFDNPEKREVRELAEAQVLTNDPTVDVSKDKEANEPPPTPSEILDMPGGDEFSTLNRYVVETEHPTDPEVPQGHDEVPKHPKLANWGGFL